MTLEIFNPTNYSFNPFAIPTLVAGVAIMALGFIVFVGERNPRVSFAFFSMTLAAAIWLFCYSFMYCAAVEPTARHWAFMGQLGIIFIPATVYNFTLRTLQIYSKYRNRAWLVWLVSGFFYATVLYGESFISGVNHYWWGYYARYEWLSLPFLGFFFGLMALSLSHYWQHHAIASGVGKHRSKALFIAFSIAYLGSFDYLAAFGIALYPFGYISVLCFIILTTRAVWRFRLVDITPAFAATEIINAMADALLVLDHEGSVRVANRAAGQLFRRPENALIGSRIQHLTGIIAAPESILDRVILSGSVRDYEFPLLDQQPVGVTLSASSFVMRDDPSMDPVAFVCIIRDVTQQKKAQLDIQRHTERQAALYEINVATTSTLESRAVLNVLLEKLTALLPETATTIMLLAGRNDQKLVKVAARGVNEESWKAYGADDSDYSSHPALRSKDAVVASNIQVQNTALDSDYFRKHGFVAYLGVPLIAQNKVLGILSFYNRRWQTFSDEEINFLRTLAGQAAGAIHNSQLYEQTKKQAADLEKASRIKDEFLGVMSHELRTPLNVIAGYTKIVQDGVLGEINAEQVKALDKVTRHSNELLVMVNSIMDATKIEAGAIAVECDELPISEFLDELTLLYEYPLGKDVTLRWHYTPVLPVIRTDRDKLKHILQNLINNALKFTEAGYVTVSARHMPGLDRIELTVADTGIGIAPQDLAVVFEKFRQVDASKTRSQGGVGLGLRIVKTFTEILGGTVSVTSQPGEGTTFVVMLPCVYEGAGAIRTYTRQRSVPETKP